MVNFNTSSSPVIMADKQAAGNQTEISIENDTHPLKVIPTRGQ